MTSRWIQTALIAVCWCLVECQHDNYNPQFDDRWPGDRDKPYCPPDAQWPCYQPPFFPYDQIHRQIPDIGTVVGRSMIYAPYRYINIFLGVPYAKPPIHQRRFMPPEDPGLHWDQGIRYWDASYYRDACPHELWNYQDRYFIPRNMSDDCLHLSVFSPNLTDRPHLQNQNFPVLVYIHGQEYKNGDYMRNPGHILAKKEVVVVTFNHRLGALGYLSTLDQNAPGNYGLMDILKVLEWVHRYIAIFRGDPNSVTLVGSGSGGSSVGLLLLSPKSYLSGLRPLFHRVIMMSGTDMCESAFVDSVWNADANTYARDLGREVGCDPEYNLPNDRLVQCLRGRHYDEIVNATANVHRRYGSLAGPFGPVVDGIYLPKRPAELREDKLFMKVPILTGVTRDAGSYLVQNLTKNIIGLKIEDGMDPGTFADIVRKMVTERSYVRNVDEVSGAMEFEYTFWAKPDNKTAVRQNLIDMWSDMVWGWCMDATLKSHAFCSDTDKDCHPTWMYVFDHRSEFELLPAWMGVPQNKDVDYLFGAPFFNETLGNITNVLPEQFDWTYLDRNISEFVQDMWTNFTKYANPTTEWTRNISWFPFHQYNLSYLHISEFSYMDINFRQNHYAFWREYFPTVSVRNPITTTPQPTPRPLVEYQAATWSLFGACLLTIFVIGALGITIWRRGKAEDDGL